MGEIARYRVARSPKAECPRSKVHGVIGAPPLSHYGLSQLESEDINLMRNEPLFDDYVILHQNIVDYAQKNASGATYASQFLQQYGKFRSIADALSLENFVQESSFFDIVAANKSFISRQAENEAKKRDFKVPFIAPVVEGTADFLAGFVRLGGSMKVLQGLPSYNVLSSLDRLMGSQNSAASSLFFTFGQVASHTQSLSEKNSSSANRISSSLTQLSGEVNEISKGLSQIPPGLQSLYLMPQESGKLTTADFALIEPDNFREHFTGRIGQLRSRLHIAEEGRVLGSSTLGKYSSELLGLSIDAAQLSFDLNYNGSRYRAIGDSCISVSREIKSRIAAKGFESENPLVIAMKERLVLQINALSPASGLAQCSAALELFSSLQGYMQELNAEERQAREINDCINSVRQMLKFNPSRAIESRLSSLERIGRPYSNPGLVGSSCLAIKGEAEKEFYDSPQTKALEAGFSRLSELSGTIKSLIDNFPGLGSEQAAIEFLKSAQKIAGNFEGGKLKRDSNSMKLAQSLDLRIFEGKDIATGLASKAVEGHAAVECLQTGEKNAANSPDANSQGPGPNDKFLKISFGNLASQVPFGFNVSLDHNCGSFLDGREIYSTGNISFLPSKGKMQLHFSKLLSGYNSIVIGPQNEGLNKAESKAADVNYASAALAGKIAAQKELLISQLPPGLLEFDPDISSLSEKVDFYAASNMLSNARDALLSLGEKVEFAKRQEKDFGATAQNALELQGRISLFLQQREKLGETLRILRQNISGFSQQDLEGVYAYFPVTVEHLGAMEDLLQKSEMIDARKLQSLIDDKNYSAALGLAKENNFNEFSTGLAEAFDESALALQRLRQNAVSSYNAAIRKQGGQADAAAQEHLLRSKKEMDANSYLSSIFYSSKAVSAPAALAPLAPPIPLAAYPLAIVILAALAYAFWKSRQKEPEKAVGKIERVKEG